MNQELLEIVFIDESNFACNKVIKCPYNERTISYALGVNIPTPGQDPDELFNECCYKHVVFADENSNEDFKNDYSSFFHQKQLPNETVDFVLLHKNTGTEYQLNNNNFGVFFGFGYFNTNPKLKGYLVEWKKVLTTIGEGSFSILKRLTIAGITIETSSFTFNLRQFTSSRANKTVRMDIVMNGLLVKSNIDFTGTAWKHSLRVPGFFGRREPQYEEDFITSKTYEKTQISMKQTNQWKFQTNFIPDCLTNEIIDFMLFGNFIYMNDYNLNNHSYDFVKFPARLSSNDGTTYEVKSRKAMLNLTFDDKFEINWKRNFD